MAIIYISAPMTGLPLQNRPLMNKWAQYLRDRGHQVLNPAENDGGSTDKPRSFYMNLDIGNLLTADTVVLLPNWELSAGCRLEVAVAQEVGRRIYEIAEFIKPRPKALEPKVTITVQ